MKFFYVVFPFDEKTLMIAKPPIFSLSFAVTSVKLFFFSLIPLTMDSSSLKLSDGNFINMSLSLLEETNLIRHLASTLLQR